MLPTTELELTGPRFRPLNEALRATLSLNEFDQMLKERVNINREDIALGNNYNSIVFEVIGAANRAGWVYKLVHAARQERPSNPVFVEYARMLGISPRGLPDQAQLESIIRKSNTVFDIAQFRQRIGEIEGRVCRVDLQCDGLGTGFLVGPDIVITNYHVVESLVKKEHTLQDFTCRFDFKVREDGTSVNEGSVVQIRDLLTYSPYDPTDFQGGFTEPDPSNLDYALLRLDGEPGSDPIGGTASGDPRGYISVPSSDYHFTPNSPLFIVQHPNKRPMKLALDTDAVLGMNANSTRVRYTTNTEPGSSGSPCFNQDWVLVALHHSGDPLWLPSWNEGIPISLILSHLRMSGFGEYLS